MYVAKNIYDKDVTYIGMSDPDTIHQALEMAKEKFEQIKNEELDNDQVEKMKRNNSPVMYCSTVTKFNKENDLVVQKKEIFERMTQRFLVIDADFDHGEETESDTLRFKCIQLAQKFNTKLVIYPTTSYPYKPRFRAIFFAKRTMNQNAYYKAMTWLFEQLNYTATDPNDFRIRNTNLPLFTNENQLEAIYDNTQDKVKGLLDNSMWSGYAGKPKPKKHYFEPSPLDKIVFDTETATQLVDSYLASGQADSYTTFWMFIHSLVRASYFEQMSDNIIDLVLEKVAEAADDEMQKQRWAASNKSLYSKTKQTLLADEDKLLASKPIVSYFKD